MISGRPERRSAVIGGEMRPDLDDPRG